MLDKILKDPELVKYATEIRAGQAVFLEGDDSQDLYILISGELDIIKGNVKIADTCEPGALFGEMSFLLGEKRTASVRARDDVKVICIPKENATAFLEKFPIVASEISRILARRLAETSKIMFGLKEFSDQLPDAVIHADKEGKILTWNRAAEKVYGREWAQIKENSIKEIFEDSENYREFMDKARSGVPIKEEVFKIRHPEKGTRYISTNTTILYDGHHNFQGFLSTGRDVTQIKTLERRYKRTRRWFIPVFVLLAILTAAVFYGYPYYSKGFKNVDVTKRGLRDLLAKDYLLLHSLLVEPFYLRDKGKCSKLMKGFFDIQQSKIKLVTGLVMLDIDRKVFDAFSILEDIDASDFIGSSYAGITFKGDKESPHKVLTLYRAFKGTPMGKKGIEIAFELNRNEEFIGWIVFQLDIDLLRSEYEMDEQTLRGFEFKRPQ